MTREAASKRAKVRLPAECDVSVARYVVTASGQAGVMLANPQGGASASQAGETIVDLIFGPQVVDVYGTAKVDNPLREADERRRDRAGTRLPLGRGLQVPVPATHPGHTPALTGAV
jgi:hypothetical protein